ncbi:MAG: aminodeoxychorismate synthase component I [Nitrospiraceae bacterium]|nr:aminodeoxychorismate synthase component I [Nitrospiraceae bacterium]
MDHDSQPGDILFVSRTGERRLTAPVEVLCAQNLAEVAPCLHRIEKAVEQGLYAAGYLSYEAAPAVNPLLTTHDTGDFPPLWFGIYRAMETAPPRRAQPPAFTIEPWEAEVGEKTYIEAVAQVRELIAAGDTYQVNYTFPMHASFSGDPVNWFHHLCRAQRADHAAYVDTGRFKILSASPELFFRLDGHTLETKPMKGTRPRGLWPEADGQAREDLTRSEKDRAENVMIVDLLRNDMGRISDIGSVTVERLFDVERYETVWQMTSTIRSKTSAPPTQLLRALFPSGSVTGAPKVRTMQIIRQIEPHPRGVYCGAIGWFGPDRQAQFNVPIRTVTIDEETARARYHIGSGITWGSAADAEYAECYDKAAVLTCRRPEFELLESLLHDSGGYWLLDEHLQRLADSAAHFGYRIDVDEVRDALLELARSFGSAPLKVRLLAGESGSFRLESAPATTAVPVRVGFARTPVDESDVFLYHKTTHRGVYAKAKASRPDCGDVLLWNRRGEVTESTTANVVFEIGGRLVTPPVKCGLLAGTMRRRLLAEGTIHEQVVTKADMTRAASIRLINSVRKWIDIKWANAED